VNRAAELLLESARDLKANPLSFKGRQKLIDASKGLLNGTTRLLDVYDDSEVRKIVRMCDDCKHNIDVLKTISDVQSLIKTIKPTCDYLVQLTQFSTKRIDEILLPAMQVKLRHAVDEVTQASSLMVTSSKAVVQNPTNKAAAESRNHCCDRVKQALDEIIVAVTTREESADQPEEVCSLGAYCTLMKGDRQLDGLSNGH
jgi:hypothetical protein